MSSFGVRDRLKRKRFWLSKYRYSCFPEVNEVDYVIQSQSGATVAPNAMDPQMQAAKNTLPETIDEFRSRLKSELDQHQQENQFYGVCYDLHSALRTKASEITHQLLLQSYFEPETIPCGDPFLYDSIRQLIAALDEAEAGEKSAENDWKRYWNVSPAASVPVWI
ncbi:uncharacterized protein BO97DRAFT_37034 [Aspergillus homomorphus CBS 101889]|uniref:Uncharacterized protein n=1 Tax=Aspergillus homomorphus (strain CBS 101889) TaxID=1450537 RepID=A0A395HF64_ASPHC|nr:hypothetical protein BO97DRAFT_37034 [Aspergillus homomorphus CBS 101889]RAL06497.1 hypothetical protein BO97DRAFT_37034 [Aspergillus homomorphus CBS 101889]